MTLTHDLGGLVALSHRLGAERAYAQGGGGNLSLKTSSQEMWIKASGQALTRATEDSFVAVDFPLVSNGIRACKSESDYTALVKSSILDKSNASKRPSIETGFHAVLGPVVVHSHSVWANVINCSKQGEDWLAKNLPDALWVPYATPGLNITHQLQETLQNKPQSRLLFLQNHGIIVSADSLEEAWGLHDFVNNEICRKLKLSKAIAAAITMSEITHEYMLFPDQAVYLAHPKLAASQAAIETGQAYDYLQNAITSLGWTPHYLPATEANKLLSMESEKYRQSVAQA